MATFLAGTASVNLHWVKDNSSNSFTFTYNNPVGSEPALWVEITRPSGGHFTITGGSATGWVASNNTQKIEFTGGSIPAGGSADFGVTASADAGSSAQSSWIVRGSKKATGSPSVTADPVSPGALDTGIDGTAPAGYGISGITADSNDQLTIASSIASDNESGLHATPYNFEETSGHSGGSNSGWISAHSYVDSGLLPNTNYSYRVQTRDAVLNESAFSATSSKYTLANIPTSGGFSNVTQTSITVSWGVNANPGGTEYLVENQTAGTNSGWQTDITNWASNGLSPNTSYTFRVKARNGNGVETSFCNLGSKTTLPENVPEPPPAPVVPEPVGPSPNAPWVAPSPQKAVIGAPGTTTSELSVIGGTSTLIPIKATPGDVTNPRIEIVKTPARIIKGAKFSLEAKAIDDQGKIQGVIEYLGYSVDGGCTWHPVTKVSGIGEKTATFTIQSFPLKDNDWEILIKAKDNSENQTIHQSLTTTIDQENPQIISLTAYAGTLEINSRSSGQIAVSKNLKFKILATFIGGPTQVSLKIGKQNFSFQSSALKDFWTGEIQLKETGNFEARLYALDGAGNKLSEKIFQFKVKKPLIIKAKEEAKVIIYEFNNQIANWQVSDLNIYGSANPLEVGKANAEGIFLPAGKYYFEVQSGSQIFSRSYSNIFEVNETSALSGEIQNILPSNGVSALKISSSAALDALKIKTMRGKDIIIFNFNPRSFVDLEQLLVYNQIVKSNPEKLNVIAITPAIYCDQAAALAQRGNFHIQFYFDKSGMITKKLFQYQSPATLFVNRKGQLEEIKSGFLTADEIKIILERSLQ